MPGGQKIDEQKERLIVELYKQGQPITRIAEILGVSPSTVWRHLKKALERGEGGGGGEAGGKSGQSGQSAGQSGGSTVDQDPVPAAEEQGAATAVAATAERESRLDVEHIALMVDEIRKINLEVETVGRKLYLDPIVLLYYAYARRKGYKGSLADFIRDCVLDTMRSRGIHLAFIEVREGG